MRNTPSAPLVADPLNSSPFTTLKATAFTPMPMASVSTAVAVKIGLRRSCRAECLRSCRRVPIYTTDERSSRNVESGTVPVF